MKPTFIAAATTFVLALLLAGPVVADEQQTQAQEKQKPQLEIEKSGDERPLGTGQVQHKVKTGEPEGMTSTSAGDITGTQVVNFAGDEIGKVDEVVRDKESGKLHAVVSVGGFLGIGDKNVAIALDDLELRDEQLLTSLASTEEQLEAYPAYEETRYEAVADEQIVHLGSTTRSETAGVAETSFSVLDADSDGYLSKEEAGERTAVTKQWDRIDKNQDDRIDQAEFSAFEAGRAKEPPAHEEKSDEAVPANPRRNNEPYGQGGGM